jgi:hypothetical protein
LDDWTAVTADTAGIDLRSPLGLTGRRQETGRNRGGGRAGGCDRLFRNRSRHVRHARPGCGRRFELCGRLKARVARPGSGVRAGRGKVWLCAGDRRGPVNGERLSLDGRGCGRLRRGRGRTSSTSIGEGIHGRRIRSMACQGCAAQRTDAGHHGRPAAECGTAGFGGWRGRHDRNHGHPRAHGAHGARAALRGAAAYSDRSAAWHGHAGLGGLRDRGYRRHGDDERSRCHRCRR